MGIAANRFFKGATKNAQDFRITDIANGGKKFQFFSPANNAGYGKLCVQEVDKTGSIILDNIIEWRGAPKRIRVDNGPEYISGKLQIWAQNIISAFSISSPENRNKMPMSNAITEPSGMNGLINTSSKA